MECAKPGELGEFKCPKYIHKEEVVVRSGEVHTVS